MSTGSAAPPASALPPATPAPMPDGAAPRSPLRDMLAGLAVAGMLLPEAVAYAAIAGVPTVHALVAALVGLSIYPLLGSSRFATVSATSSAAAIFASVVAASGLAVGYATVGLAGGLFVLLALLRADFLAAFVSRPVLRGFTWALAVTIVIKQIPHMTGLHATSSRVLDLLPELAQHITQAHAVSTALGLGALLLWLLLRHWQERRWWLQPSVIVLVLGMVLSVALDAGGRGVALVGAIDLQGMHLQWPMLDWNAWLHSAQLAPALLLILFAESWGSVRSLALQQGDTVSPRREMLALGAANMASSLLQGLPVGAGFSASSANYAAGGRSKLAGVAAALAIALLLWLARGWLVMLPVPVLAAIVAGILSHKLGPRPLFASLRLGGDAWLALVAAAGVLLGGVLFGMLLAVGLSLLLALRRFAQPAWSELGHLPGSHDYLDIARHPEVQRTPGVLVLRPEEPVFFANAESIGAQVQQQAQQHGARVVVLSMEACDDLDSTSVEAMQELQQHLHQQGSSLLLARVKDPARAALQRAWKAAQAGEPAAQPFACYWSVDDAMQAAQQLLPS